MVGIVFMIFGSLPFVLFIRALRGEPAALWRSSQVRAFLGFVAVVVLTMSSWLAWSRDIELHQALLKFGFNITSIVTTTGFASEDHQLWGALAVPVFFIVTFVGGCTGSTAGGIKIFRFQLLWGLVRRVQHRLMIPHGDFRLHYEERPVTEDVIESTVAFVFAYVATTLAFTVLLGVLGLDFLTSISAVAQAMANVGPGLGEIVGPAGKFSTLPETAKLLLALAMLLGQLELLTIFMLFSRRFWRE